VPCASRQLNNRSGRWASSRPATYAWPLVIASPSGGLYPTHPHIADRPETRHLPWPRTGTNAQTKAQPRVPRVRPHPTSVMRAASNPHAPHPQFPYTPLHVAYATPTTRTEDFLLSEPTFMARCATCDTMYTLWNLRAAVTPTLALSSTKTSSSLVLCRRTHMSDMPDAVAILALINHPRFRPWRFAWLQRPRGGTHSL
jgi:hypothetical protein